MLTELCAELRNYFVRGREDIHHGEYTISGGQIQSLPFLKEGQFFRIVGSVFNDGVWQYGVDYLKDETFEGAIWAMRMPPAVVALSQEIEAWVATNQSAINSPYTSESFGGYSYTLRGSGSGEGEGGLTWQNQFAKRLSKWRKLHEL